MNLYGMVGNNAVGRWDYLGLDYEGSFDLSAETKPGVAPGQKGRSFQPTHEGFSVEFNLDDFETENCDEVILSQSIRYEDEDPKIDNFPNQPTPGYPVGNDQTAADSAVAQHTGYWDAPRKNGIFGNTKKGTWYVEICALCIMKGCINENEYGVLHSVRECLTFEFDNFTRKISNQKEGSSTHGDWRDAYADWQDDHEYGEGNNTKPHWPYDRY